MPSHPKSGHCSFYISQKNPPKIHCTTIFHIQVQKTNIFASCLSNQHKNLGAKNKHFCQLSAKLAQKFSSFQYNTVYFNSNFDFLYFYQTNKYIYNFRKKHKENQLKKSNLNSKAVTRPTTQTQVFNLYWPIRKFCSPGLPNTSVFHFNLCTDFVKQNQQYLKTNFLSTFTINNIVCCLLFYPQHYDVGWCAL
eukprot:TRINITY_DN4975_c0_g1_i1.p2 TRINITY_DN4975_c0_g1~~TRINITY_DN4975_c0_g1_i1.p2  ORF type:complete len:193 (-),score=-6.48 TRINITY_DN4975_c0_g1_i1:65-643(-)